MNGEFRWKPLINEINRREVVPVIGDDLSIIELTKEEVEKSDKLEAIVIPEISDGKVARVNLYKYLAVFLAEEFDVKFYSGKVCLNDVVMKILANWPEMTIYNSIGRFYSEIRDNQILLEPFRKLTRISDFNTYITVNFDDFIERAFHEERTNFNPPYNLSLPLFEEAPNIKINSMYPTLFNILGSIHNKIFALTDENFLEYIYFLKRRGEDEHIFKELFKAIEGKSFLLIGCSFPNWLMRFFIRIISNEPFSESRKSKTVADNRTPNDQELSSFLEYYKVKVINISKTAFINAIEFVNQLFDEWLKGGGVKRREPIYKEEIFLSYSSNDRNFVELIRNEFEKQGVKVFYDEIGLNPGDIYDPILREKVVRECQYFIPFISRNSISDTKRYAIRNEWRWADARRIMNEEKEKSSFIKPYIIDDTRKDDPTIPYDFGKLTIGIIENNNESIENMVRRFILDNNLTQK